MFKGSVMSQTVLLVHLTDLAPPNRQRRRVCGWGGCQEVPTLGESQHTEMWCRLTQCPERRFNRCVLRDRTVSFSGSVCQIGHHLNFMCTPCRSCAATCFVFGDTGSFCDVLQYFVLLLTYTVVQGLVQLLLLVFRTHLIWASGDSSFMFVVFGFDLKIKVWLVLTLAFLGFS